MIKSIPMKKNLIKFSIPLLFIFAVISCSKSPGEVEEVTLDPEFIQFSFTSGDVITNNSISVTITDPVAISSVQFFVDGSLKTTVTASPYTYTFDDTEFQDGTYNLRVVVELTGGSSTPKEAQFKIDNNGPFLTDFNILPNQTICGPIGLQAVIEDVVSDIARAELFINGTSVYQTSNSTQVFFNLNPDDYATGNGTLRFVLEDVLGNISEEEYDVQFGKQVVSLRYPNNFIRQNSEKLIVVLSNANGDFLDSKQYSNSSETITFCSPAITTNDTEFMLTFFEVFDDTLYNVYNYSGLTKNNLGDLITFTERPLTEGFASVNIDTSNLTLGGNPWASGTGYSIVTINDSFSGTLTTDYGQGSLGTNNTFVQIANSSNAAGSYQYAFIADLQDMTSFANSDFTTNNIITHNYSFNNSPSSKLVKMFGYENETLRAAFSGHQIFTESLITNSTASAIAYADIFDSYFYSIKGQNYYVEGTGALPSNVTIPGSSISHSLNGDQITFQGLPNYEVGKVVIRRQQSGAGSPDNPNVTMNFIFDGSRTNVVIPKIPEGIFVGEVTNIFNNATFTEVQAVAENYDGFNDFEDYLREVFVPSKPFILTVNKRERIFDSSVSSSILPIYEYPYWERF